MARGSGNGNWGDNGNGRYELKGSRGCGEWNSSGSFAALRMTAETCSDNRKSHGNRKKGDGKIFPICFLSGWLC